MDTGLFEALAVILEEIPRYREVKDRAPADMQGYYPEVLPDDQLEVIYAGPTEDGFLSIEVRYGFHARALWGWDRNGFGLWAD